jgi:hypothetical protein
MSCRERTSWLAGLVCAGALCAPVLGQQGNPAETPALPQPIGDGKKEPAPRTPVDPNALGRPGQPGIPRSPDPNQPPPLPIIEQPLQPPAVGQPPAVREPTFFGQLLPPDPLAPAKKVGDMTLEEMLQNALRGHTEILSAQSKVRDAEIDLIRVRQKILVQIATYRAEYEVAKAIYADAKARLDRTKHLLTSKAISVEEYKSSETGVVKAKAELTRVEAALAGAAAVASPEVRGALSTMGEDAQWRSLGIRLPSSVVLADPVGGKPWPAERTPPPGMSKAMDKLLKTLATPVEIKGENINRIELDLATALVSLRNQTGIDFHLSMDAEKLDRGKFTISRPIPLGAMLQWVEDTYKVRCVVRDYGVVVTNQGSIPPGAIHVMDVWRQSDLSLQGGASPRPSSPAPTTPGKTPASKGGM